MIDIRQGDVLDRLREMPDASVHCCVTSPPYWGLRDYGVEGQIGLEATPELFVAKMIEVFGEVRRVLRDDGTLWLNLGDTYHQGNKGNSGEITNPSCKQATNIGSQSTRRGAQLGPNRRTKLQEIKPKDLVGIPWMVAFALRADGWYLRSDIIWSKPNPMPESVTDRPTKAHEYIFLLTKSPRYFYDAEAIKEPCSPNTHARISQDLQNQVGSFRANGGTKTNGPMKAVIAGSTRKMTEAGSGNKNNRSFEAACVLPVADRNSRSVWSISTQSYSGAHFATFPEDLIEPCIKAGTSEKGCCPECGAPWEREVERHLVPTRKAAKTFVVDERDAIADRRDQGSNRQKDGHKPGYVRADVTLGWKPSCECVPAEPIPCTVLDPFMGSGTTLLVARKLGRSGLGIELNPQYIELARRRTGAYAPLFNGVQS